MGFSGISVVVQWGKESSGWHVSEEESHQLNALENCSVDKFVSFFNGARRVVEVRCWLQLCGS